MILVDFDPNEGYPRLGIVIDHQRVIEVGESANGTLMSFILNGQHRMDELREVALTGKPVINGHERRVFDLAQVRLHAPIRNPRSLRDFYAFETHVKTANENRGREVPPAWYDIPVFYFSNPSAIFGEGDAIPYPSKSSALDYELEVACIIGKEGRDIPAEQAEEYIFGYVIMNDWSARDLQKQEMSVGLGPAKGKDFATSLGAYLVTPDELADRHTGRAGVYDLSMVARVNGEERSRGNWSELYWTFGQMLERASDGVTLYPGDVIGSGTVGTGCLLEITRAQGPWLQSGDVVELEIERLGVLRNTVSYKVRKQGAQY